MILVPVLKFIYTAIGEMTDQSMHGGEAAMSNVQPLEVFCSYAPEDESSFQQLQKHCVCSLARSDIVLWHHRRISPGIDWAQAIDGQVNRASVILLLISADFLNSDYCYGVEMKRALERQSRMKPV